MIEQLLQSMLQEQSQYNRDKQLLFEQYIKERLDKSFTIYEQEVNQSLKYLSQRKELPLMKRLIKKL